MLSIFLVGLFGGAHGHMGISSPVCREKAVVNDAYRYPNAGHCHGVGPRGAGTEYAAGSTVTLTLSGGAAHNGGHCALFLARRSDLEQVWFKQIDDLDCTTKQSFAWDIKAALVPTECGEGEGCTLIWAWTPKSSGGCEIYMNCFDVKISGGSGGVSPAATTITKDPSCIRVDAAGKTAHFGAYCGTECAGGSGGETITIAPTPAPPPTATGATMAPTPVPITTTIPYRCGASWVDANSNCKSECTTDGDCTGEACYADMTNYCGAVTESPTAAANVNAPTPQTASSCRAVPMWSGSPGMNVWCAQSCPTSCPPSHCTCKGEQLQYVDPSKGAYVPICQTKTVNGAETMKTVALEYDLSAYRADYDNEGAAEDLLKYNQVCKPELATATVDTMIPSGTTLFITGDCQLTNLCSPTDQSTAYHLSVSVAMVTLGVMLLASL